ncbi:hypothetical protein [Kocuria rosea]|uniref:hypothetical protein n=1 Tax=Kocuria rosea TaxID=1275 RepID=UPI002541E306|nr:hypothetical protein [Kocuria rosea]WIG18396.1 hypothetical protein QOY29_05560 [Kocuria rosea]
MNGHESHVPGDSQNVADEILHADKIVVIEGADLYAPRFFKYADILPSKNWNAFNATKLQSAIAEEDLALFVSNTASWGRNITAEVAPNELEFTNTPIYNDILKKAQARREQATKKHTKSRRSDSPPKSLGQPVVESSKESITNSSEAKQPQQSPQAKEGKQHGYVVRLISQGGVEVIVDSLVEKMALESADRLALG